MFKLILILAVIYIVLKIINTNAKLAEKEARRAEEEEERRRQAEEDEMTRDEAVDVEAEVYEDPEDGGEVIPDVVPDTEEEE